MTLLTITFLALIAALFVIKPHPTIAGQLDRRYFYSASVLNRMADEIDLSQPNLASELRNLASRD